MGTRQEDAKQGAFTFPHGWGGRRKGAGRKPSGRFPGGRAGVPHRRRGELPQRYPVQVTARLRDGLPSLRGPCAHAVVLGAFRAGCERFGFRLVHYAVLGNHMHYLVEARDRRSLTAGLRGLHVRVARRLNQHWGRRGNVFPDRFHERVLRSPREVWASLAYVLKNARKHGYRQRDGEPDRRSSGRWFEGWRERRGEELTPDLPVVAPLTWLLGAGWRRCGLVALNE